MEAYYANIVAYRVTPTELVLDFGDFFPGQDKDRKQYDHTDLKTRVVMSADMIEVMIQALNMAKNARDESRKSVHQQPLPSVTQFTADSEHRLA